MPEIPHVQFSPPTLWIRLGVNLPSRVKQVVRLEFRVTMFDSGSNPAFLPYDVVLISRYMYWPLGDGALALAGGNSSASCDMYAHNIPRHRESLRSAKHILWSLCKSCNQYSPTF